MDPQLNEELAQKLIDAVGEYLSSCEAESSLDLEQCIAFVKTTMPDAQSEHIVAILQMMLSPMGEGEDDFMMGEDYGFGEGFGGMSPFSFDFNQE